MKAGGGHAKGADFERVIAKRLSAWASHGDRSDIFWRTPGSGSRATQITAVAHGGDICATHESGAPFCNSVLLECKSYRKIDWRHLLMEQRGEFHKFWRRLLTESKRHSRRPLLVLKENGRAVLLGTDTPGNMDLFYNVVPIVTTADGMFIHTLETLLIQPYEVVCTRLVNGARYL